VCYCVKHVYCLPLSQLAIASAERSFSKLEIIKTCLRSKISQDRLDGLALLAIENGCAKQLNMGELIDTFVSNKARIANFMM
jgi:hAT family C-terminal dimerisation region